jgi:hypothetical protein
VFSFEGARLVSNIQSAIIDSSNEKLRRLEPKFSLKTMCHQAGNEAMLVPTEEATYDEWEIVTQQELEDETRCCPSLCDDDEYYADLALSSATSTSPLRYFLDPQEDNNFIWIVDDQELHIPTSGAEENDATSDKCPKQKVGIIHDQASPINEIPLGGETVVDVASSSVLVNSKVNQHTSLHFVKNPSTDSPQTMKDLDNQRVSSTFSKEEKYLKGKIQGPQTRPDIEHMEHKPEEEQKSCETIKPTLRDTIYGLTGTYQDLYGHGTGTKGCGTIRFDDGSIYQGDFRRGVMDGWGKLTWADGSYYNGSWQDGLRHGIGYEYNPKTAWFEKFFWHHGQRTWAAR